MLDIYIPTFGRSEKLTEYTTHIHSKTTTAHSIIYIVEAKDTPTLEVLKQLDCEIIINRRSNCYAGAINSAWESLKSELFFVGADDLVFYPNWYEAILPKLEDFAVIGTNDLHNQEVLNGEHATHYFVKGCYIEEHSGTFDKAYPVLFEGYDHNYTDKEFIETAKYRGVFTPCLESVVEHLHFTFGLSQLDDTYRKTRLHVDQDEASYMARRKNWGYE